MTTHDVFGGALTGIWIGWWIFLIVMAIIWFLLPFAIFGTKPILREINENLKKQNVLLLEIYKRLGIAHGLSDADAVPNIPQVNQEAIRSGRGGLPPHLRLPDSEPPARPVERPPGDL